ncbi:hypothetical protein MMC26_003182 [Xylographa opegraphella]|nr:hypothetical protein [Xylographa opegraphella]
MEPTNTAGTQTMEVKRTSSSDPPSDTIVPTPSPLGTPLVTPVNVEHHPHDDSIVHYEDEIEQLNSSYQVTWSKVMEEGQYKASSLYESAAVLLLSWDEALDDMKVKGEVDRLAKVFEDIFCYDIHNITLKAHTGKTAQSQINFVVAKFVSDEDRPKRLLIVYYAGHGTPGHMPGHLELFGKSTPRMVQGELNKVIWNRAEDLLQDTQADVLEIFDCCYAGNLGNVRSPPTRAFEYLAATAPGATTRRPGPESFTSALIWALKALVAEGRPFTTQQLVNKIKNGGAPGFPNNQKPVLSKRGEKNSAGYIMLEPIRKDVDRLSLIRARSLSSPHDMGAAVLLNLKFMFETRPSEAQVEILGKALNEAMQNRDLRVNRIMWGGLHSWPRFMMAEAVQRFTLFGSHRRHRHHNSGGSSATLLLPADDLNSRQRHGYTSGHNALFVSKQTVHEAFHENFPNEHINHGILYHGTMLFIAVWAAAVSLVAFLPDKGRGVLGARGFVSIAGLAVISSYAFLYAFVTLKSGMDAV